MDVVPMKKKITALLPFPEAGWTLGVVLRRPVASVGAHDYKIGALPIVGMVLDEDGEIEPVVALSNGRLVPTSRLEYDVLCMAAPEEDLEKIANAAIVGFDDAEAETTAA